MKNSIFYYQGINIQNAYQKMKKSIKTLWIIVSIAMTFASVSCSSKDEPQQHQTLSEKYAGSYKGDVTLEVGGQYKYESKMTCVVSASGEETITLSMSEYSLSETMMGNLTLGEVTIPGLVYDSEKGGFFRELGGKGFMQTMNGTTFPINDPSSILVKKDEEGRLSIEYPFTLGKMPLPMTALFNGINVK